MRYPGFSFQEMVNLVYDNNWQLYQVFSDALLIAIFWEETQFNNIAQEKGTAVGLGQVEPRELWTLKKYGVFTNAKNILNSPAHAVEVTSYYLRHLYESQSGTMKSRNVALRRYGGYYYDHAAWRLKTIGGWEACERALDSISTSSLAESPDEVMNALALARGFPKSDPNFRNILFP